MKKDTRGAYLCVFWGSSLIYHTELEEEIEKLEAAPDTSPADKIRLKDLKAELEKVNKRKEEYVAEHPEHRKLVFKARRSQNDGEEKTELAPPPQSRNLFNKHGLPRHPERSIYYDPVMNPYGVPPPGMPYVERREHTQIARWCMY